MHHSCECIGAIFSKGIFVIDLVYCLIKKCAYLNAHVLLEFTNRLIATVIHQFVKKYLSTYYYYFFLTMIFMYKLLPRLRSVKSN